MEKLLQHEKNNYPACKMRKEQLLESFLSSGTTNAKAVCVRDGWSVNVISLQIRN